MHAGVKHSINRLFLSEANIIAIDIFDLFLMVLRIIQVQGRSGFPFFDIFLFYQLQYLEIHECLSETLY